MLLRRGPATVSGIECEFLPDVPPGQRLLRAAAQIRLPFLDHAAVLHRRPEMAGIVGGVGILGVDHVSHFGGKCEHFGVADRHLRERAEPDAAMDKTGREQIRRREFGGIAVARALLVVERLPQPVHRPFRHLADDLGDVLSPDAASGHAPSERYSMMPPAMLPAMPSASTICLALSPSAARTPAAAPIAPKIAVG